MTMVWLSTAASALALSQSTRPTAMTRHAISAAQQTAPLRYVAWHPAAVALVMQSTCHRRLPHLLWQNACCRSPRSGVWPGMRFVFRCSTATFGAPVLLCAQRLWPAKVQLQTKQFQQCQQQLVTADSNTNHICGSTPPHTVALKWDHPVHCI